ncbi:MAG TPA: M43 family zinc metalloprotease [Puia sp.]|nr:M43 family zinc metalloprotease [Puia sp.]
MSKYFLPLLGCLLIALPGWSQTSCRSFVYRQQQLSAHPELATAVAAVEQFTRRQLQPATVGVTGVTGTTSGASSTSSLITIPVVVHVLYNTSAENISDQQIVSQIAVLNRDYQKLNPDTARIPSYFVSRAANIGLKFILAGIDTNGNVTTGIVRKHTDVTAFTINDDMKSSAMGGDDPWDRDEYLNIWVCNLEDGTLGYSSLVGGPKNVDGVVVQYTAFGTTGTARAPYNLGRTCTHEIGHWFNLIHTWGDAYCGDDEVADTPPQSQATYGNPSGIVYSCNNAPTGNMYMNYMDFTDDVGMHMFTNGQRDRMMALFATGGPRYPLLSSPAATAPPGEPAVTGASPTLSAASLYPNPASSYVSINLKDPSQIGSLLEVYNQMGQIVMGMRITQANFQLNISGLAGGLYFVRLGNNAMQASLKFVKL